MGENSIDAGTQKYIWFHRLEVSAILYLIISFIAKISIYQNLNLLFIPALVYYFVYPNYFDSKIPFTKRSYLIILEISGLFGWLWLGGYGLLGIFKILNSLGYLWWSIEIFVIFNAIFILIKVFKLKFPPDPTDPSTYWK